MIQNSFYIIVLPFPTPISILWKTYMTADCDCPFPPRRHAMVLGCKEKRVDNDAERNERLKCPVGNNWNKSEA
jgi:hypothetical protein